MITVDHLSGMGEALKELRWQARMKQVEVCRATGLTAPQVSRYENGHEMPTVESLVKYLGSVGADLCDLQSVLVTGQAPNANRCRLAPSQRPSGVPRIGSGTKAIAAWSRAPACGKRSAPCSRSTSTAWSASSTE